MITYNISINNELAEVVENAIKNKKFANRSEFFRDLVRKFELENEEYEIEEINPWDSDYNLIKNREKNASFIPLSKLI